MFIDIACIPQADQRQKGRGHSEHGCIFEAVGFHAGSVGSIVGDKTATWIRRSLARYQE